MQFHKFSAALNCLASPTDMERGLEGLLLNDDMYCMADPIVALTNKMKLQWPYC